MAGQEGKCLVLAMLLLLLLFLFLFLPQFLPLHFARCITASGSCIHCSRSCHRTVRKHTRTVTFVVHYRTHQTHHTMRLLSLIVLLLILLGPGCGSPAQPLSAPVEPAPAELVARGEYLVNIMGCNDCHSPKIMGPNGPMNDPDRILSGHPAGQMNPPAAPNANPGYVLFGMGGTTAVGPWGTSFSGNLTSDATGIGNWTEEQFKRAITKGLYKGLEGSRQLLPPMPWENYKNISDADVHAIFSYLKSTKPVENVVPAPLPPVAASH